MACQIATAHQPFFPPAMNVGILRIIPLLDDASITTINSQSGEMCLLFTQNGEKEFSRRFTEPCDHHLVEIS